MNRPSSGIDLPVALSGGLAVLLCLLCLPLKAEEIRLTQPVLLADDVDIGAELGSMLCIDPFNANKLVAGFLDGNASSSFPQNRGNKFAYRWHVVGTQDGGLSWSTLLQVTDVGSVDPDCAFSIDGAINLTRMKYKENGYEEGYHGFRSTDAGTSWKSIKVDYSQFLDRGYLAIDRFSKAYRGRIYLSTVSVSRPRDSVHDTMSIKLFRSEDGGASYTGPAKVDIGMHVKPLDHTTPWKGAATPGPTAVLRDGTVIVIWHSQYQRPRDPQKESIRAADEQPGMSKVMVARSTDGGGTLEAPIVVANGIWHLNNGTEPYRAQDTGGGKWIPAISADTGEGPLQDRVYAAWMDMKGGRRQIWFSSSSDKGLSWDLPRVISDGLPIDMANVASSPASLNISMTVNKQGIIGVLYYAQIKDVWNREFQAMFMASLDGGITWTSPQPVLPFDISERRLSPRTIALYSPSRDYTLVSFTSGGIGLNCSAPIRADANGTFHMLAFANPQGPMGLYHAKARVDGVVVDRKRLAQGAATLFIKPFRYDGAEQTYITQISVRNESAENIPLPLRLVTIPAPRNIHLRHTAIAGDYELEFIGSHNGRTTAGAYWVLGDLVGDGSALAPGSSTMPKTLKLKRHGISDQRGAKMDFLFPARLYHAGTSDTESLAR